MMISWDRALFLWPTPNQNLKTYHIKPSQPVWFHFFNPHPHDPICLPEAQTSKHISSWLNKLISLKLPGPQQRPTSAQSTKHSAQFTASSSERSLNSPLLVPVLSVVTHYTVSGNPMRNTCCWLAWLPAGGCSGDPLVFVIQRYTIQVRESAGLQLPVLTSFSGIVIIMSRDWLTVWNF